MKIRRLSLENYKSYKNATINFDEGINCILGKNGAGKSTIIEAIGTTLFNYDIRKSQFQVRYGEKTAKLELEYEGKDGTIYIITKKVGNNSSVKIKNLNTNEIIENTSNVYTYVKETLGIKQERSLPEIYKEIIAVPQGEFVSVFLETEAERKKKIDNLFNLDIYNDIWKKLGEIESLNRENISSVEKDKKYLDGQVVDIEEVRDNVNKANKSINSTNEKIENINNDIKDISNKISEQNDIKNRLDEKQSKYNELEKSINILDAEISTLNEALIDINKSIEMVNSNKEAYEKYNNYVEKEKEQDERIKEFNEKNSALTEEKSNLKIFKEKVKSNDETINKNNFKIGGIEGEKASLIKTIFEMENNLEQLKIDYNKFETSVNEFESSINDEKSGLKETNNNYLKINLEYQTVCNFRNVDIDEIKSSIESIEKSKQVKKGLDDKIKEINDQLSMSKATKLNIEKNMASLQEGRCPIFNNTCSNLGDNNLIVLLAEETDKIKRLSEESEKLSSELSKYEDLDSQLYTLNYNKENYNQYLEVSNKLINDIKNLNLFDIENIGIEEALKKVEEIIKDKEKEIGLKEKQLETKKKELFKSNTEIVNKKAEFGGKNLELSNKNNDIEECKNQIKAAEKNNVEVQKSIEECNNKIKELNAAINKLKDCNDLKQYYINMQGTVKQGHDLYMKNVENASKYDEKIGQINGKKTEKQNIIKVFNELKEEISDIKIHFNNDEYEKNKELLGTLQGDLVKNEALLNEFKKQYTNASAQLAQKEKIVNDIQEKEKLIDKYGKVNDYIVAVRNIMKNLPKELSRRYRESISQMSTIFYQKISKENVSIELDETYRVLVIDNEKKSNKKEMSQLSGGEQMSLAISIRISMLKYFAGIDMYFLDEPTVNLDVDRRFEIADVIKDYSKELRQLFVISHDDTFESITTNILKIEKVNNESELG